MALTFYVNIGAPDALNYGVDSLAGGAIGSALYWRSTSRMDRAGQFEFAMPAADPKASLLAPLRVARAMALVGGTWQAVAAGIIERVEQRVGADGQAQFVVSGPDLLGELAARIPSGAIDLTGGGAGVTLTSALATLAAATGGWSLSLVGAAPQPTVYGAPSLDPILATLVSLAGRSYTHFYAPSALRQVVFTPDWTASGVRAIRAGAADLAAETCAITGLAQIDDAGEVAAEVWPFGAGNAEARLTIAANTRTAPAGYGVRSDGRGYSMYSAAAETLYGVGLRVAVRQWSGITPLSSTTADMQTAANALFDEALRWLQQHEQPQRFYELQVAGAASILRPMQTLRVVYFDPEQMLDIDDDLYILEATTEITADGMQTVRLTVATVDRWPDSDVGELVARLAQAQVYASQPQLNANSYAIPYARPMDLTNQAEFRFRLDADVWQLTRATFDFQVLPLESTVKSVAADTATSSSGGGTTATSSSGGGTTATSSSGGGTTATSSSGGGVTATSSSGGAATSSSGGGVTPTTSSGGAATSSSGGSSTPTTSSGGSSTPTTSSGGSSTPTTAAGDKSHLHTIPILNGSSGTPVLVSGGVLYANTGGTVNPNSNFSNVSHTHDVSVPSHSHTVTVPDHSHSVTIGSHTHTVPDHTHTVTVPAHTHTVPDHTHSVTVPSHTHSVTVPDHTHSVSIGDHTHSVSIGDHTHTVSPTINTVYGIYRDASGDTFELNDLEYSVDGSTWYRFVPTVNGYTTLGDGWSRVDLTALLQEAGTLRPAQANNLLRMRARTDITPVGKRATIDAQLTIRNIIQAVALAA